MKNIFFYIDYAMLSVRCLFLFLLMVLALNVEIIAQTIIKFNRVVDETTGKADDDIPIFDEVGWIYFYLTGYYSKWEAEQNQIDPSRAGVKHEYGDTATWRGVKCWSTKNLLSPKDSVTYGPHYRQDKKYNRWFEYYNQYHLSYVPRLRMALDYPDTLGGGEDVCKIKVVFSYRDSVEYRLHDTTFLERTLKVEDFDSTGDFKYFYFSINPDMSWYNYYPDRYMENPPSLDNYIDWEEHTGIEFRVDWLRTDTLCRLYIDFVEVYDRDGWDNYVASPEMTIENIKYYISDYMDWKYIPFLSSQIKLTTIDNYFPVTIIDSLLREAGAPSLLPEVDEYQFSATPGSEIPVKWILKEHPLQHLMPYSEFGFDDE
jgi:hypothetical protein